MNKRLGFVFLIALLTGAGIVLFQLYWLSETFKINRNNFYKTASNSLQKSINDYQLESNEEVFHFGPKDSTITVYSNPYNLSHSGPDSSKKHDSPSSQSKEFKPEFSRSNLNMVKVMMTKMVSKDSITSAELGAVRKKFQAELKKNGIDLPFSMAVIPPHEVIPARSVIGFIGLSEHGTRIKAIFPSGNYLVIRQTAFSLLLSLALILLTSGCLYYMWYTIRQQAQLDEVKNDLITNITHEFRTPVSILKTTHEALDKFGEAKDHEKVLRYIRANQLVLNKLEDNVDRILNITQYEKKNKGAKLEPVMLKDLIQDVILRFEINSGLNISYFYDMKTEVVKTDKFIIDTIVSNLIDNALKYGGEKANVQIWISQAANHWRLKVQDDGPGIPNKYLPLIFDKYYRIPTGNVHDVKGYGLGLSYVKELTSLLKGELSVQSTVGKGTAFSIQFYLYE